MCIPPLLVITNTSWAFVTYLMLHLLLWHLNESHLREISTAASPKEISSSLNKQAQSMSDQTINSTDPLTAKDQIPVDLHVLALDSSEKMGSTTLLLPRKITESFVLSFDTDDVEQFKQRNNHSGLGEVLWVPSVDEF